MRILFVSALERDSASGRQRLWALRTLGHDVVEMSLNGFDGRGFLETRLRERLLRVVPFRGTDEFALGEAFANAVEASAPDLVWVEKALLLTSPYLLRARQAAPHASFVCFQDDDPFGLRRGEMPAWSNFKRAIPDYDVHFVKREENVSEFMRSGARRVLLFMHGVYSPVFHPPRDLQQARPRELVFVGTPLDHRVAVVDDLIEKYRLPLHVMGNGWFRARSWHSSPSLFHPEAVEQAYGEVLRASKIALGFVSSTNRDQYSMRSFEIPACGAMLLAERTDAHEDLFAEGREAEFFESAEECADKCRYYLEHDGARKRIAAAGCAKVSRIEHSLATRMADALERISGREAL
jgi:spore maturation protein CgeB